MRRRPASRRGTLSLRDLAEIALKKQPGTQRLLLVVDQWEELYTLCRDDEVIRSFTDQLLDAAQDRTPDGRFHMPGGFLRARPRLSPSGRPHPGGCPGLPGPDGREGTPGGRRGPRSQSGAGVRAGSAEPNPRRHGPGTGPAAVALLLAGAVVEAAAGVGPDQRGVRRDGRGRGGHRDRGRSRIQPTPGTRPGTSCPSSSSNWSASARNPRIRDAGPR